jgi:predicted HTH transcriptional regulator
MQNNLIIKIQSEQDLILLRESEDVEFKAAIGRDGQGEVPSTFWETYSAMANTNGGFIFLGVTERDGIFSLAGLSSTGRLRKNIADIVNNKNKVSVNLLTNDSLQDIEINGNLILCISIPKAKRSVRPVFLNNNPIGNSYRRFHEADQRLTDEDVKRFLAEQLGDTRDNEIITGFDMKDIYIDTLKAYRQLYTNLQPEHPWNELENQLFLEQIGGGRRNRETNIFNLTVAGLLMFGSHPVIQERFPYYMLDYQELPPADTQTRWIDRLTLDGSWSGNLFDFHRRIYPKLIKDLKIPFQLEEDKRINETPVHVALREALVNALVHADYSDKASVLVIKRQNMFRFRNPGLMRVSWETAMRGGESDCRNRTLHQMFRYVGFGEQAGSGIPKIIDGWKKAHWRQPSLSEKTEPYNQTVMELRMLDLFPTRFVETLRKLFNGKDGSPNYEQLDNVSKMALMLACSEQTVNHERLRQFSTEHPADLSRVLHQLVENGMLQKSGNSRNAVYHLTGFIAPLSPDEVFEDGQFTTHSSDFTTHSSKSTEKTVERDSNGCIIHKRLKFPMVDKIDKLTDSFQGKLKRISETIRYRRKASQEEVESTIQKLCLGQYVTISALGVLLNRAEKTLRNSYLSRMVNENKLKLAFPQSRRDKRQAYITVEPIEKQ